jgi:hypothetical protein
MKTHDLLFASKGVILEIDTEATKHMLICRKKYAE